MVTIAFVGDVMLGRGVNEQIPKRPPESFWGNVLEPLRAADTVVANLECAITDHAEPWSRTPKVFHFRAGPKAIEVLKAAGVRCVSLANNHTLDFEVRGLLDTLEHLDGAGIRRAGAGRDAREAAAPALFDAGPLRVGMVAFTDNEPPFAAGPDRPGTNHLRITTAPEILDRVERSAEAARRGGAELVILSLHWGPNMVTAPPPHFRDFARAVVERGVDLVHGHSAHLFQGVEVCGGRLILYDTGDFLDDYAVDPKLRNDWSLLFLVDVDGNRPRRLRMLPVRLTYAEVNLAAGAEREAICKRMVSLSRALGTHVTETGRELELTW